MILDEDQKADFVSYYGNCPLIDKDGNVVTVEAVEKRDKTWYWSGYKYYRDPADQENISAVPRIRHSRIHGNNLEQFEPMFIEPGYYQLNPSCVYWFSKRTDRNMVRGLNRQNSEFLTVNHISDKMKSVVLTRSEFDVRSFVRIKDKLLKSFVNPEESVQDAINRVSSIYPKYSLGLSKNVALVSTTCGIPAVFYKLVPAGYFLNGKIYISQKKDISKEMIQEECNFETEVYEG